jgi:hypothetical protein
MPPAETTEKQTSVANLTPEEVHRMNQVANLVNNGPHKSPIDGAILEAWETTPLAFIRDALEQGLDEKGEATEMTRQALISAIDRYGKGRPTITSRVESAGEKIIGRVFDGHEEKGETGWFPNLRRVIRVTGYGALVIGGLWLVLVGSSFAAFLIGYLLPSAILLIYSILATLGAVALATVIEAPIDIVLNLLLKIAEKIGLDIRQGEPLAKRLVYALHDWLYIVGIFGGAGAVIVVAWLPAWSRWLALAGALVTLILISQDIRHELGQLAHEDALRRRRPLKWLSYTLLAISFLIVPAISSPQRVMRAHLENGVGVIYTPNAPIEKNSLTDVFGEEAGRADGPLHQEEDGTLYSSEELSARIPGIAVRTKKDGDRFQYLWRPTVRAKLADLFGLGDWYAHRLSGQKEESPEKAEAQATEATATPDAPAVVHSRSRPWWLWPTIALGVGALALVVKSFFPKKRNVFGRLESSGPREGFAMLGGLLLTAGVLWLAVAGIVQLCKDDDHPPPVSHQQTAVMTTAPATPTLPPARPPRPVLQKETTKKSAAPKKTTGTTVDHRSFYPEGLPGLPGDGGPAVRGPIVGYYPADVSKATMGTTGVTVDYSSLYPEGLPGLPGDGGPAVRGPVVTDYPTGVSGATAGTTGVTVERRYPRETCLQLPDPLSRDYCLSKAKE